MPQALDPTLRKNKEKGKEGRRRHGIRGEEERKKREKQGRTFVGLLHSRGGPARTLEGGGLRRAAKDT